MGTVACKERFNSAKYKVPKETTKEAQPAQGSAIEEDIIIKCNLEEMVKRFFKDCIIVWHDPNVGSEQNKLSRARLERLCEVQTFTEWEKAANYIRGAKAACHVITSGTNGELLVKEIWASWSVLEIYIFCGNKEYHSSWARNFGKVSCVETQLSSVLKKIEQNLLKWYKDASSLKVNLPAFAPIFDDRDKSEMNNLHLYLKVLPNFNFLSVENHFLPKLSRLRHLEIK